MIKAPIGLMNGISPITKPSRYVSPQATNPTTIDRMIRDASDFMLVSLC